ncbi:MAG: TRAP transporter large permease subunit, partial [Burkholderiaceae bacterium]
MGAIGLWMLPATLLLMAISGLPAWIVLISTAMMFAVAGMVFGVVTLPLFFALPSRLLGLLENDLLQALPLYVLIGVMLNHLPLAEILFRVANRILRRTAAAPYLAGMGLGSLLAPMNGSVGASVAMLAHAVQPRLDAEGVPPERGAALICAASTIGVLVPPSLVLILLSDAMMRAHTEALNATHEATRVINTQDIFHGALFPAIAMLLLFFGVTWWRNRDSKTSAIPSADSPSHTASVNYRDWLIAGGSVACILALLISVSLGYLYAVEGAATGGLALMVFGLLTRSLSVPVIKAILHDTLAITGALFAVLVAATCYTLVLRAFEVDLWMNDFLHGLSGGAPVALIVVLLILVLSAFVLDAFEITFVIVPIVMPPLLTLVPDATWVSVLTLLVLQTSFLLPPFGYAIMMVGSVLRRKLSQRVLARAALPYLFIQFVIIMLVLIWPSMVWHSDFNLSSNATNSKQLTDEEVEQMLDQQRLQNEKENE